MRVIIAGVFFVFNLAFAIIGLLIISMGLKSQHTYYSFSDFLENTIWTAPILTIFVGTMIFIIAFLGCCGAVLQNGCMMLSFVIILIVILIVEITIAVTGYTFSDQLDEYLELGFNHTFSRYEENLDLQNAWKFVQTEMNCCGITGPSNWEQVYLNSSIPRSCCHEMPYEEEECSLKWATKIGCLPVVRDLLQSNVLTLAKIAIALAVAQMLDICFACCLFFAA